jgi:protein-disulfide isomerase
MFYLDTNHNNGGSGMTFGFRTILPALALSIGFALPAMAQEATTEAAVTPTPTYMALGPQDAKVTIIEYASFTCPHCANFHEAVFKPLKAEYIDTGKVRFEFREVYFDKYGLWGAMTARCGGDLRYFGIADILLSTQQEWAGTDDAATVVENLKRIGRTVGMDDAVIDACLNDDAMAQALVTQYQTNAGADGVEGTPTLFINGEKHANMAYADLKAIIDPLLAD